MKSFFFFNASATNLHARLHLPIVKGQNGAYLCVCFDEKQRGLHKFYLYCMHVVQSGLAGIFLSFHHITTPFHACEIGNIISGRRTFIRDGFPWPLWRAGQLNASLFLNDAKKRTI
jgi:hypothetical protein